MARTLKTDQWWGSKIPPLLGVAYLATAVRAEPPSPALLSLQLCVFLVACLGIGGLGYLVTDAFDVEEDRRSGRPNGWAGRSIAQRVLLVGALLLATWLPWRWLPNGGRAAWLVAVELALFLAYAVPPLRLKERGLAGVMAAASYAHVLPMVVAWVTFAPARWTPWELATGVVFAAWMLPLGMRHLLRHQHDDLDADRLAGVRTYAVRHGRSATMALIVDRLLPLEASATLLALGWLAPSAPLLAMGFAAHAAWEVHVVRARWLAPVPAHARMSPAERHDVYGQRILSAFVERWLAPLGLATLVWHHPAMAWLVPLHLLAFGAPLRDWWRDTRSLPRFGAEAAG
jgi:4-hydroxybenzoate polyprenyltransferase